MCFTVLLQRPEGCPLQAHSIQICQPVPLLFGELDELDSGTPSTFFSKLVYFQANIRHLLQGSSFTTIVSNSSRYFGQTSGGYAPRCQTLVSASSYPAIIFPDSYFLHSTIPTTSTSNPTQNPFRSSHSDPVS